MKHAQVLILGTCLALVSGYLKADVDDGLLAYYPFSGSADDFSGNGNHGIVHGAALAAGMSGLPDTAYAFDGMDDYISTPASITNNLLQGTVFANVKIDSINVVSPILSQGGPGEPTAFYLAVDTPGVPGNQDPVLHMGTSLYLYSGSTVSLDEWTSLAATWDGASWKIFIDGSMEAELATSSSPLNTSSELKIGRHYHGLGPFFFDGIMDEVRIYDRPLSQSEIESLSDLEPTMLTIDIDIRPGSDVNPVNLKSKGVLPVTVFGDEDLDVSQIDLATLELDGATPRTRGNSGNVGSFVDVDGDSILDLILHFSMDELGILPGTDELILTGMLTDGTELEGSDSIRIVPLGDTDGSGTVDGDDLSLLLANWGPGTQWEQGNFNSDNTVNEDDLSLLLANWGASGAPMVGEAIPEPVSLSLLAMGAMAFLRRRHGAPCERLLSEKKRR